MAGLGRKGVLAACKTLASACKTSSGQLAWHCEAAPTAFLFHRRRGRSIICRANALPQRFLRQERRSRSAHFLQAVVALLQMRRLMRSLLVTRLARALSSRAGPLQSHLSLAHSLWRATLQQGDIAVDATAGVGHDAAILASLVGPGGTLHALDVDAAALEACTQRVRDEAGETNAACLRTSAQSHAAPPPGLAPRSATVVAFNLGFLPTRAWKSDRRLHPMTKG